MLKIATAEPVIADDGFFDGDELVRRAAQVLAGRYSELRTQFTTLGGVYCECFDKNEERRISIKLIPGLVTNDRSGLDALRREVRTCLKLSHPNVVRILTLECVDGLTFIRMDHLGGTPLLATLGESRSADVIQNLFDQMTTALTYAHGRGVLHGDLRPEALLVDDEGRLTIVDFGIASVVTQTLTRITGRTAKHASVYSAPEAIRGKAYTEASDHYSLACILYELLTESPPFFSGDLAQQHLHESPEPLPDRIVSGNPDVSRYVTVGLTKDHEQRITEVRSVLGARATDRSRATDPARRRSALRSRVRRMGWAKRLTVMAIVGMLSFGIGVAVIRTHEMIEKRLLLQELQLRFRDVPDGNFMMGERDGAGDSPEHLVVLPNRYQISPTEVSLRQYLLFLNATGGSGEGVTRVKQTDDGLAPARRQFLDLPATGMSWAAAVSFCQWLNQLDPEWHYRLPTEAEWEHVVRLPYAGKRYSWGNDAPGGDQPQLHHAQTEPLPVEAAGFEQNLYGFHFLGNAAEWVHDVYDAEYYGDSRADLDPRGPERGDHHVVRGCSYADVLADCRTAARRHAANQRPEEIGFRIARQPRTVEPEGR